VRLLKRKREYDARHCAGGREHPEAGTVAADRVVADGIVDRVVTSRDHVQPDEGAGPHDHRGGGDDAQGVNHRTAGELTAHVDKRGNESE
jgi:hypothetical protein